MQRVAYIEKARERYLNSASTHINVELKTEDRYVKKNIIKKDAGRY